MSAAELERIERVRGPFGEYPEDGTCPMLTADQRCSVYELRPLVCRLWGMSEQMPCAWGCTPSRFVSRQETRELMEQSEKIGGRSQTHIERVVRSLTPALAFVMYLTEAVYA